MSNEYRFIRGLLIVIAVLIGTCIITITYTNDENRKAYYKCLEIVERVANQKNKGDDSVRIVSLPTCYNR